MREYFRNLLKVNRMASPISVRPRQPLISSLHLKSPATLFLTSRNNTNNHNHPSSSPPPHKWTHTNNAASAALRLLPHLHHPHRHLLPPPLSICRPLLLPRPPLPSLLRPRPPHHRYSLSTMTTPATASDSSQSSSKTVRLVIKGRVQGVFYRNWTIENATELELKGWVRNRRDGSVETLLSGNPDAVQEMEQRCRRGPPSAMVTGLEVFPSSEDPGTGFERKQTV